MKTLIVIDMQNDFITGPLGTKEAVSIVPKVKAKIEEYEKQRNRIIFTRDIHEKDYLETHEGKYLPIPHCIKNSDGCQIYKDLHIGTTHNIFDKDSFGFTMWRTFHFDEVEIVGLCTDICVISNALILRSLYPEIEITVDASCCAGTTPEMHKKALDVMRNCHIKIINEKE